MNVDFEIIQNGIVAKMPTNEKLYFKNATELRDYMSEEVVREFDVNVKHHSTEIGEIHTMTFSLIETEVVNEKTCDCVSVA